MASSVMKIPCRLASRYVFQFLMELELGWCVTVRPYGGTFSSSSIQPLGCRATVALSSIEAPSSARASGACFQPLPRCSTLLPAKGKCQAEADVLTGQA
ncbi:hypothetical protein SETIT_2G352100v2 [Setaria italica]|uniref:Uncharacterized protein n=1 Tax=Setaria italica TaxID=4555 RepID=A0A368Q6K9_SETIT|nr:hypothetical protein SETIT_2G352100v2 [Setaria italica]